MATASKSIELWRECERSSDPAPPTLAPLASTSVVPVTSAMWHTASRSGSSPLPLTFLARKRILSQDKQTKPARVLPRRVNLDRARTHAVERGMGKGGVKLVVGSFR